MGHLLRSFGKININCIVTVFGQADVLFILYNIRNRKSRNEYKQKYLTAHSENKRNKYHLLKFKVNICFIINQI